MGKQPWTGSWKCLGWKSRDVREGIPGEGSSASKGSRARVFLHFGARKHLNLL